MKEPKKKWSLWKAGLLGLALQIGAFVVNNAANNNWSDLAYLNASIGEALAYFAGRLLFFPLIFVLVAFIRNRFV